MAIFWTFTTVNAQMVTYETDSIEGRIYFHLSKTEVDLNYMDNANRIRKFIDEFRSIQQDTTYSISSIDVIGAASPEGYHAHNIELSQQRAAALIKYLERFVSFADYVINVKSLGSDWAGLRRMVVESGVPHKQEILDIIDSEPVLVKWNGRDADSRLRQLHELADGAPFEYIETFILPYLRESYIKVTCKYQKIVEIQPVEMVPVQPVVQVVQTPEPEKPAPVEYDKLPLYRFMMRTDTWKFDHYKLIFAFRENLLLPFLNIGVEVPFGNRISVAADHYYPWLWRYWPTSSNQYCYEMQWEELNIKYWTGEGHRSGSENYRNRLLGQAFGIFGVAGYYDLEHNWSGTQGEIYGVGISYQYAKPICKGRMHLELALGVGYMYGEARSYDVVQYGGKLIRRRGDNRDFRYIGPLKADISLIFPLYRRFGAKYIRRDVTLQEVK